MTDEPSRHAIRMQVHASDWRVDGILRLIEEAGRSRPLGDVLQTMCQQVAVIAHADIVSVYVREDGELVMRANVGFPEHAVGQVRLAVGEGITGFAAECMCPVSANVATEDPHFKPVPELGEEQYPAFLAVPLFVGGAAGGVLVMQRREAQAFAPAEVALAMALATTFGHALERAASTRRARDSWPARSARLLGSPLSPGAGLGRAVTPVTFEGLASSGRTASADKVERAFRSLRSVLGKSMERLGGRLDPATAARAGSLTLVAQDQRLRHIMRQRCEELGVVRGLQQVAKEYASASYRADEDAEFLSVRAFEIESLCLLVAARAVDYPVPAAGTVLCVPEHLSMFAAMAAAELDVEAVAVDAEVPPDDVAAAILRAEGCPLVAGVAGLFAWVRSDDTVMVDGDEGIVRINPPAMLVAEFRRKGRG